MITESILQSSTHKSITLCNSITHIFMEYNYYIFGRWNHPNPKNVFNLVALLLEERRLTFLSILGGTWSSFKVYKILLIVFCCFYNFLLIISYKWSLWWARLYYIFVISQLIFYWMKSSFIWLSLRR